MSQQEDDLRALAKIMDFLRAVSIILVVMNVYWFCYEVIRLWGVNIGVVDRILLNFDRTAGLFHSILYTKLFAVLLLALSCLGTKGVKGEKITWGRIWTALAAGSVLFFLNWWILALPLPIEAVMGLYVLTIGTGYVCLLMGGLWMSRLLKHNLMEDVFNNENESFMQETRLIESEYSVNLPTRFYYKKRWNNGWINVVNPFRASIVLGTPGSGKSYAVVNNFIKQQIEKGFLDAPYNDKLGAVYERYDDRDIRKQNYIYDETIGNYKGMFLKGAIKANYGKGEALKADADRDGQPIVYVDQVGTFMNKGRNLETVMSPRWGETTSGVRLVKYPIYPESVGIDFQNIDEVEFRLTEVVYMLAECKMRAGDSNGAKELVNNVRKRYFTASDWAVVKDIPGPGFTDFDMDWMLSQWGLEFLSEGRRRRTDLRRFDKFTQGQWWFFGRATEDGKVLPAQRDRKYEWYPLPSL